MNEENNILVEETQTNILSTEKIEENLLQVDKSINELLKFFQTEKDIQEKKEQELLKEQDIQEKELLKEQEIQEKKEEEFLQNINTIAENTSSEINVQLLQDVSNLMQVNIMTLGLLIGIVCISLFSKFFRR